jgi:hypothetical protein
MGRDPQEMDPAGGMLHNEQHVQPLEQQRVDAEEVCGENAACLSGQELWPTRPVAARCGIDANSLKIDHTVLAASV